MSENEGEKSTQKIKYDSLTQLPLITVFMKSAKEYFESAYEKGADPVMIFFDLNAVKPVIARYGEEEGNRILKGFSDLLRKYFGNQHCTRPDAFCFYAFTDIKGVSEDIPAILSDANGLSKDDKITVKVGVFNGYRKDVDSVQSVCYKARYACQSSTHANISGISYFDDKMDEKLDIRTYVINNIDRAINNGSIKIYYQSQLRLLNDKYCGAEALTRWEDPVRGHIPPSVFVPILEENNLTWKLDTFVVREVARGIKRCIDLGLKPLPISVNLTYADFLVLNVPETVIGIVRDNGIDPSLIVIEVTEKTVLKNPELMGEEIEKLHRLDFAVVIDDFGNGYSSINMLSDFRFDGIKIDMDFMSSFNDRSKKIVESIVAMSKKLGIHTISEGVETKEQLEFLRSVGCQIVQGYYCGKPRSLDETLKGFVDDKRTEREDSGERELFAKAGLIDLITDKPMALAYFDREIFDVFYANDAFYRLFSRTGFDMSDILNGAADPDDRERFTAAAKRIGESGLEEDITFSVNGRHMRLATSLAAGNAYGFIFKMILSRDLGGSEERQDALNDRAMNDLLSSFNNVYLVDLNTNSVCVIRSGYGSMIEGESYNYDSLVGSFVDSGVVYQSDRDRFLQTYDTRNLRDRLSATGQSSAVDVFRLRLGGSIKWAMVRTSISPDPDDEKVLICVSVVEKEAQSDFVDMSRQVAGLIGKHSEEDNVKDDDKGLSDGFLWRTLMDISDVKYFWKDNDRRFLGASSSFLEFYGFDSVSEVLGRNDEEMAWHPDDTQYKSDELDVIEKGAVIRNSPGQIYAKGAKRDILATKYPVYKNGEVVGLIGYFMDTDSVLESKEEMDNALFTDVDSGLMNTRGLFLVMQGLDDNYRRYGTEYAVCMLELSGYRKLYAKEGKDAAEKLLLNVMNNVKRSFSEEAVIAKTGDCAFTVCEKNMSGRDIKEHLENCAQRIGKSIEGKGLSVNSAFAHGSEKSSMHEVFTLLLNRFNTGKRDKGVRDEKDAAVSAGQPDVIRDMPLPFIITRPVISLSGTTDVKYIFVNNKYCEYSGLSRIDMIGKSYKENFSEASDWISYAGRAANGETVTGRVYENAFGQWMDYIATPSSIPGCCNTVFWPVEDSRNERELLTKGHEADNAIIRIARFLNTGDFEEGIDKSLAELGRVLKPDRVYMLDTEGVPIHEWRADGVTPRSRDRAASLGIELNSAKYAFIEDNCIVVDDLEVLRKIDAKAYEYLTWEGIRSYMLVPLYDNKNEVMGFVGVDNFDREETNDTRRLLEEISYFISSRMVSRRLLNRLNIMSTRDELTGLLNRHGFRSEMEDYLDENPDQPFTIVLVDIDDFKIVNDVYGHAVGDLVLKNLADDLNEVFSERAIIARTGGDEIGVALKGYDADAALPLIREMSEMEHSFLHEGKYYPFRLSIGFASYPEQADDLSLLLREADAALYTVKSAGKHGFRRYSPDIKTEDRMQLAFNIKNVVRYIPGAILVHTADKEKQILYANEELIEMFGCSDIGEFMEYTGGSFDGIVHPEDRGHIDDIVAAQVADNENLSKEHADFRILTKNDKVRHVMSSGRFVDSEYYGKVFYVVLLDKEEHGKNAGYMDG